MKNIYFIISLIVLLSGCGRCTQSNDAHNEVYGVFSAVNDYVYYIDNNKLYKHNNNEDVLLGEHVLSVQKYNNTIFYISSEDNQNFIVYKHSDNGDEIILHIPGVVFQQSIIYDGKLFICADNRITEYDIEKRQIKALDTGDHVSKFCVDHDKIYFWSIHFNDYTLDDFVDSYSEGDRLKLYEGILYSFDNNTNETKELFRVSSDNDRYMLFPTKHGVVFFDPDEKNLNIYHTKSKKLLSENISNFVTDEDNVYYSLCDGNIYKLDICTGKISVFAQANILYGFNNNYLYLGDNASVSVISSGHVSGTIHDR